MKSVRTDFDCDINKILSKRFKIKLNTTSFKITERLPLNDRDIKKIKESYKENLALVNLKKIEITLISLVKENQPKLQPKHIRTITSIILEMIKPQRWSINKYITITEFSKITGIKNASIKKALLDKKYLSSKFPTIPTKTAICKDVVKVRQYKHFKNPDLDLIFYWKKSFLFSIFDDIEKDMKPKFKIFNYRKPKDIHEAFNSINYILGNLINFKNRYMKRKIYSLDERYWLDSIDYSYKYMESHISTWKRTMQTDQKSIIKHIEFRLTQRSVFLQHDLFELYNNKKSLYVYDPCLIYPHSLPWYFSFSNSLLYNYYMYGADNLQDEISNDCELIMMLHNDTNTKNSAVYTINRYFKYIIENKCKDNCEECQKWVNYKNYKSYIYSSRTNKDKTSSQHVYTPIKSLIYSYDYDYYLDNDFFNDILNFTDIK